MEPIVFQTPSGHSVTIKPTLTYPEKRRLQRVILSGAKIDPDTGERSIDMGIQIEAQDALLKMMVIRLILKSGRTLESGDAVYSGLSDLPDADIQAIYDKLDDVTRDIDIFPRPERGKKANA